MSQKRKGNPSKPGPEPETLKADGVDWEDAIKHALNKPKPEKGWEKGKKAKDEEEPKGNHQ